ncbi:ankyrin repeat domain-containing protein SOWAHC [Pygocentrus nattereri]|uniref:ankyrin repeat domain-containing protein SOWAHC n=1 Tax=Pygocentrus nattereri TaxID=42514 RepID=UPI000814782F|nr:ankyrin repeat domain-containing protein SOWAHC [Pygocentrus nattereri]
MATDCSQESLLEFLTGKGGRVRSEELMDHFKEFVAGETDSAVAQGSFRRFVDNVADVKQESGEKVVCLKKKYRRTRDGSSAPTGASHDPNSKQGVPSPGKGEIDGNEKLGQKSDMGHRMLEGEERGMDVDVCLSDVALVEASASDGGRGFGQKAEGPAKESREIEVTTSVKLAGDADREAGACGGGLAAQLVGRRRTSRGSQRSLLAIADEVDAVGTSGVEVGTPRSSRRSFVELMMSSSPQVRRSLVRRSSQGQMAAKRRDSLKSEGDSGSVEEDCASVTLDPLEHEWMMCASDGEWDSLQRLLVCDPGLVTKKDFVTGFTCLHWAAKQGKHELLALLITFAQQHSVAVNVNGRSSAGYTPLHLAAMHNHVEVMKLLVGAYDADLEARDYSGKKPSQYLDPAVAGDIRDIVGACGDLDAEKPKLLAKPKSLYRKASIGRIKLNRGRVRAQIVHSTSFRETEEGDGSLKSPLKSRPVSNLFG